MTAPNPESVRRCIQAALADARVVPEEVDAINGHLTATGADPKEVQSWSAALGCSPSELPPITSTKSMIGHLLGAAGGVETAVAALALYHDEIPPTINQTTADPECDLDCVPNESRRMTVRAALNNSFGFGGTNASILLRKHTT